MKGIKITIEGVGAVKDNLESFLMKDATKFADKCLFFPIVSSLMGEKDRGKRKNERRTHENSQHSKKPCSISRM